jgi:hypothetical protein
MIFLPRAKSDVRSQSLSSFSAAKQGFFTSPVHDQQHPTSRLMSDTFPLVTSQLSNYHALFLQVLIQFYFAALT